MSYNSEPIITLQFGEVLGGQFRLPGSSKSQSLGRICLETMRKGYFRSGFSLLEEDDLEGCLPEGFDESEMGVTTYTPDWGDVDVSVITREPTDRLSEVQAVIAGLIIDSSEPKDFLCVFDDDTSITRDLVTGRPGGIHHLPYQQDLSLDRKMLIEMSVAFFNDIS